MIPETPIDALGDVTQERVLVDEKPFFIQRPANSDGLLDHPTIQAAFAKDEYMPYWADLWPAARMLAKVILREPWTPGLEALEIGCGLGLPGVAALARGLRVIFSDYDATALRFAELNARLNGFDSFRTRQVDWREPPDDLRVSVVLGSDLIYELRNVSPLVRFLRTVLLPGGFCLMTDQDRVPSHAMRETLASEGLEFTTRTVRAGEPGGRRLKGTLYRIRHACSTDRAAPEPASARLL